MSNSAIEFRSVSAGRGLDWITEGWGLFKQAPLIWIAMIVLWIVAMMLVSIVPVLGSLAVNLSFPIVIGGLLLGAHAQSGGQALKLDRLWAGFSAPHLTPLLLLGVAYLVIGIVIGVIAVGLAFASLGSAFVTGEFDAAQFGLGAVIGLLLILAIAVVFSLATWFAPALVVFAGQSPIDALKLSFSAALANLGALVIYGLLAIVIIIVASIPFGLGLLVAFPLLFAALYCSYRDIFGDSDVPAND